MTSFRVRADIPVAGGALATSRLGSERADAPVVLAIHGITSTSRSWLATAGALGDVASLAAVDLRGGGGSHQLPGPFGIAAHVRDMVAVLDALGLGRATVVGHSLGAYIAAALAIAHPDRVAALVLVDGGLTIPLPPGTDPERFLEAFLGPAIARLRMTFPDREAYRAWWAAHPAFATGDVDRAALDEYADYDLVGAAGQLHSSVNAEAVRQGGVDLFATADARSLQRAAVLLCAPRGLQNEPNPMQPLELVREWEAQDPERRRAIQGPDGNHHTTAVGRRGSKGVPRGI